MKVTKPSLSERVAGLPMSCTSAPKRSAVPRLISSASGSASSASQLVRSLAAEALQVRLDLERALEHGHRVAVDVEVVVGALFDPAQRLQLRQDDRR